MRHTDWDELQARVRLKFENRTGPVRAARTASTGLNSQLAVILDIHTGAVFVKGLPLDHPGAVRQEREAMINLYVRPVPRCCYGTSKPSVGISRYSVHPRRPPRRLPPRLPRPAARHRRHAPTCGDQLPRPAGEATPGHRSEAENRTCSLLVVTHGHAVCCHARARGRGRRSRCSSLWIPSN